MTSERKKDNRNALRKDNPHLDIIGALEIKKQPEEKFFKDEGGKDHSLEITITYHEYLADGRKVNLVHEQFHDIPLKHVLCFEDKSVVDDPDNNILTLIESVKGGKPHTMMKVQHPQSIIWTRREIIIKFRLNKVSRRYDNKKFRLLIEADIERAPALAGKIIEPCYSVPILVCSKRRERPSDGSYSGGKGKKNKRRMNSRNSTPNLGAMPYPSPAGYSVVSTASSRGSVYSTSDFQMPPNVHNSPLSLAPLSGPAVPPVSPALFAAQMDMARAMEQMETFKNQMRDQMNSINKRLDRMVDDVSDKFGLIKENRMLLSRMEQNIRKFNYEEEQRNGKKNRSSRANILMKGKYGDEYGKYGYNYNESCSSSGEEDSVDGIMMKKKSSSITSSNGSKDWMLNMGAPNAGSPMITSTGGGTLKKSQVISHGDSFSSSTDDDIIFSSVLADAFNSDLSGRSMRITPSESDGFDMPDLNKYFSSGDADDIPDPIAEITTTEPSPAPHITPKL